MNWDPDQKSLQKLHLKIQEISRLTRSAFRSGFRSQTQTPIESGPRDVGREGLASLVGLTLTWNVQPSNGESVLSLCNHGELTKDHSEYQLPCPSQHLDQVNSCVVKPTRSIGMPTFNILQDQSWCLSESYMMVIEVGWMTISNSLTMSRGRKCSCSPAASKWSIKVWYSFAKLLSTW